MATVIRDAIDRVEDPSETQHRRLWSRFESAVGGFHGGEGDASERHDAALTAAYAD